MAIDSEPTRAPSTAEPNGPAFRRRDLLLLAAFLLAVGALALVLIHGPAKPNVLGSSSVRSSSYAGLVLDPSKPAPALALDNYLGQPVNIDEYRGKAVLVTFLYTHCPDVCPLIASMLHTALEEMSSSERREVQIIAVSVDPRGDTPATVGQFLAAHEMTGQMQYLIGSAGVLRPVWKDWGVAAAAQAAADDPDLVAHTALVYGITARGKITVIYPSNFSPGEIVHDVKILSAT